jgi:hypothetical protein
MYYSQYFPRSYYREVHSQQWHELTTHHNAIADSVVWAVDMSRFEDSRFGVPEKLSEILAEFHRRAEAFGAVAVPEVPPSRFKEWIEHIQRMKRGHDAFHDVSSVVVAAPFRQAFPVRRWHEALGDSGFLLQGTIYRLLDERGSPCIEAESYEDGEFYDPLDGRSVRACLFSYQLSWTSEPLARFRKMVKIARRIADVLGGDVVDADWETLDVEVEEDQLSQRVSDLRYFEAHAGSLRPDFRE